MKKKVVVAKKAQLGGLVRKGMRVVDPAVDAAKAKKVVKKLDKTETAFDRKVARDIKPITKKINVNKYNEAPATPVKLTDEQKANNARILQEIKEGKRKNGGPVKSKAKGGGLLGGLLGGKNGAKMKYKAGGKMGKCKGGC